MLKSRPVYRYGLIVLCGEKPNDPLRRQLSYVIRTELHMMRHMGMFGQMDSVDPDGMGLDLSMLRSLFSSQSEWVYMTRLFSKQNMFKVLWTIKLLCMYSGLRRWC